MKLGEALFYEQPTKYIVESEFYNSNYKTPVLTAGKSFILGYTNETNGIYDNLPCIIFDDFTTDAKYVNFPFKVKSSAMKILTTDENNDLRFLYYFLSTIKVDTDLHKRYWISVYANLDVNLPSLPEQKRIADELDKVCSAIEKQKKQLALFDELIKSKFNEMFGDPVINDKGWNVGVLETIAPNRQFKGEILSNENNKFWLLNLDKIESQTGEIVSYDFVGKEQIGNSTISFSTDNVLYSKLRPYLNKVVIPKQNGYGTSELLSLTPDKKYLNNYFLLYLLRSSEFVRYIKEKVAGAKMPRVSMDVLRKFYVILPPLPLQQQFADFVNEVEETKLKINQSLNITETLYKALMQKYFEKGENV